MRVVLLVFLVSAASAQTGAEGDPASRSDSTEIEVDTVATARRVLVYGRSVTYRAIASENARLRRRPSDGGSGPDPFRGIGRLVVDETVSRTGAYFYDVFYQLWNPPDDAQFVSVSLTERPLPGQGTLVGVRLDGELVFQARLPPREEEAEGLARRAVGATLRRLTRG